MRYFLTFSYNGTPFHGWQRQPNVISVQEVMEDALSNLLRTPISLTAAGRTDTGVHARQMIAHFDANLTKEIEENLVRLLNRYLKTEIAIDRLDCVQKYAHARFDAISRTYEYHIDLIKNPFRKELAYQVNHPLNFELMNEAAQLMMRFEDFESFSKTNTDVKTFLCNITQAHWETRDNGAIFTITANRFLRNMVRAIVGTLIEVGIGKISVEEVVRIIECKDRSQAGFSVPASGLYLTEIRYPKSIYIQDGKS